MKLREETVMLRRVLLGAAVVSLVLAGPASAADSQVQARDNFFSPSSKTVNINDRVRWTNALSVPGTRDHTSTANLFGLWNFNLDQGNTSDYFRFLRAGNYAYRCLVHPATMKGTVQVRMKNVRIDSNSFTIRAATAAAPAGFVHDIQRRKQGTTTWTTLASTSAATVQFNAPSTGTWQFRARLRQTSNNTATGYSPIMSVVAS